MMKTMMSENAKGPCEAERVVPDSNRRFLFTMLICPEVPRLIVHPDVVGPYSVIFPIWCLS